MFDGIIVQNDMVKPIKVFKSVKKTRESVLRGRNRSMIDKYSSNASISKLDLSYKPIITKADDDYGLMRMQSSQYINETPLSTKESRHCNN